MGRYLIVANQTLGGTDLDESIREVVDDEGVSVFYVVVPTTRVKHEEAGWMGGFPLGDPAATAEIQQQVLEAEAQRHEAELEDAQQRARQRLERMIEKIHAAGGRAEGEIGTADPVEATRSVLDRQAQFDAIIVSTLPSRISRWLKMDVPSKISRLTEAPVITIEARD